MNMIKEEFIRNLAEQKLADTDKFVVSVKVNAGNNIRVFIDADTNVSISDCAQLSRFIESQLNEKDEVFELIVSSAGLDSPLLFTRQYKKNIGREVTVLLKDGAIKKGKLAEVNDNGFEISVTFTEKTGKKKELKIERLFLEFEMVKETRLVIGN